MALWGFPLVFFTATCRSVVDCRQFKWEFICTDRQPRTNLRRPFCAFWGSSSRALIAKVFYIILVRSGIYLVTCLCFIIIPYSSSFFSSSGLMYRPTDSLFTVWLVDKLYCKRIETIRTELFCTRTRDYYYWVECAIVLFVGESALCIFIPPPTKHTTACLPAGRYKYVRRIDRSDLDGGPAWISIMRPDKVVPHSWPIVYVLQFRLLTCAVFVPFFCPPLLLAGWMGVGWIYSEHRKGNGGGDRQKTKDFVRFDSSADDCELNFKFHGQLG